MGYLGHTWKPGEEASVGVLATNRVGAETESESYHERSIPHYTVTYTKNRCDGFSYDLAGNLTNDLRQTFVYDVTGQQTSATYSGYSLTQNYDGDTLRAKKTENGVVTYYLRSSVLGGQVLAEVNSAGGWHRGFVYDGAGQLIVLQSEGLARWVHQDPFTKSQRVTDSIGGVAAIVDLDPHGMAS